MLPSCPAQNWLQLREELDREELRPRRRVVVLVDGDRTLTPEDTSRSFLERASLPLAPIKESFQHHGYTYPGFLFHASVYLQVIEPHFSNLCREVAASVTLFAGAAEFLRRAAQLADVYVVTAGVAPIWSYLLEREGLDSVRVLGGIYHGARFLIGREEKGQICQYLQTQGCRVVAFGDSDVDTLMLQGADRAVVVVNHRRNDDLLPHLHGRAQLFQIALGEHVHTGLPRIDFLSAAQMIEGE